MYSLGTIDMATEEVEQLAYADCFGPKHLEAIYWCEEMWAAGGDTPECGPLRNQNYIDKLRTLPLCPIIEQSVEGELDCSQLDATAQATLNCLADPTLTPACALYANEAVVDALAKQCPDLFPQSARARAMQWALLGSFGVGVVVLGGYFLRKR